MYLTRLLTQKDALQLSRVETTPLAPNAEGETLLAIRHVALTTNNITYAAFGDAMQYWNFFPTGQAEWGHMPVWGFADVVSRRRRCRPAFLRLLPHHQPPARLAGARERTGFLRRRGAPPEPDLGLQPVHPLQR